MGERNNRRILNKIASMRPGVRQALDALNCLNYALDNDLDPEKVGKAFDLLQQSAGIWREQAARDLDRAREICEAKWPNKLPRKREE